MQLNLERLEEVLFMFSQILPLGNLEKQAKLQKNLNLQMSLEDTLGILMKAIHTMMKENPAKALGYLDFIKQAIQYTFEERNDLPEVDNSEETLERTMKIWRIGKHEK